MKQVWITEAGAPRVLQVRDAPDPVPGPGEVCIVVEAIGVNFADIMGRLGVYPDAPRIPYVPGYEVAGRVESVGEGVDAGYVGLDVMALLQTGGYSERVCVPAYQIVPRPINMPVEHAAGFLVAYLTAYAGLVAMAGIRRGERVLIHAAAGGVGLAAVDVCRIFEATIYGTASAGKHEFLHTWGVQHTLGYRGFQREIMRLTGGDGVHIALDTIGGRSWLHSFRSLSPGGRLVVAGVFKLAPRLRRSWWAMLRFGLQTPWLAFNPVALANSNKGVMGVNLARLTDNPALLQGWIDALLEWYAAGRLRVRVDRVFALRDAPAAHHYMQSRQNVGKVILMP